MKKLRAKKLAFVNIEVKLLLIQQQVRGSEYAPKYLLGLITLAIRLERNRFCMPEMMSFKLTS